MKKASLEEGELANGTNSDCSDSPKSSDDSSVVVTETYSMTATTSEQDSQEGILHCSDYIATTESW